MYLSHHGVVGMKWGVRRYQNPDGTLTSAGKVQRRGKYREKKFDKTNSDVDAIFESMSSEQRKLLSGDDYDEQSSYTEGTSNRALAQRYIQYYNNTPVSFIDVWDNGSGAGEIAIGTRPDHQGRGHASKGVEYVKDWFDRYGSKSLSELHWDARVDNRSSNSLAKRHGFEYSGKSGNNWNRYIYNKSHNK